MRAIFNKDSGISVTDNERKKKTYSVAGILRKSQRYGTVYIAASKMERTTKRMNAKRNELRNEGTHRGKSVCIHTE